MAISLREMRKDDVEAVMALRGYQRHEYGQEVLRQVVALVRDQGATELLTSHVDGEGGPAGFYARLGFVPTGELDPAGEVILRLVVDDPA